jgi:hypothetical protein
MYPFFSVSGEVRGGGFLALEFYNNMNADLSGSLP